MKILFGIFDTKGHIHDEEMYHVHQGTFGFTLVWELQGCDLLQMYFQYIYIYFLNILFFIRCRKKAYI